MRALILLIFLVGCGANPLSLLTGGGPNVAANVQAGKTNTQTIGVTQMREQTIVKPKARTINQTADENRVRADKVETIVVNEGIPISWWIALVIWSLLLWELPRSSDIAGWIRKKVTRRA